MACCGGAFLLQSSPAVQPALAGRRSRSEPRRSPRDSRARQARRRGDPSLCRAAAEQPSPPSSTSPAPTGAKPPASGGAPASPPPPPPSNILPSLPVQLKAPQAGGAAPGSFLETMGFSGPGPEIINARLAMWGFLWVSVHELTDKATIAQQAARDPFAVGSLIAIITLATFLPVWVAEEPLGELLEATRGGMPSDFMGRNVAFLKLFTVDAEKGIGRAAMLGFLGALVVEQVAGAPLFGGALTSFL